jgi:hypothetical protein
MVGRGGGDRKHYRSEFQGLRRNAGDTKELKRNNGESKGILIGQQFIVAGGKEGPTFDWVSTPVFSSDGRKVAYAAADGRELWLNVLDLP